MMRENMRAVTAVGLFGFVTMGVTPFGCSSRLAPVWATQKRGGVGSPELPHVTVERSKECVAEHGTQLEPGRHEFKSLVQVNEDGYTTVQMDGLPDTAYDLGACMRNALRDMPIADEPFREGVKTLNYRRKQATAAQRSLVGSPVVVVVAGVTIIVSELVLEAGAYTILFAVTVEVVDKAVDDVAEALKRKRNKWRDECAQRYSDCMDTPVGDQSGNTWKQTLCGICAATCDTNKTWPSYVGNGSCEYWKRGWGPQ